MGVDEAGVLLAVFTLAFQVVANRGAKARVHDPVHGPGGGRHESPRHLVLALRPGFETLDATLDAELDALVITGLEMQAVMLLAGAPVAAVQRAAAFEEHR